MNTIADNPEFLINQALSLQAEGLHIQARNLFERAKAIDSEHPSITKFINVKTKRTERHGEYYDEPKVSCCCCPGCNDNLANCFCKLAICDFCCVPGGCCMLGL